MAKRFVLPRTQENVRSFRQAGHGDVSKSCTNLRQESTPTMEKPISRLSVGGGQGSATSSLSGPVVTLPGDKSQE